MNKKARSVNWGQSGTKAFFLIISLLFLLVLAAPEPTTIDATAKVQPMLADLAANEPDTLVEIIVQKVGEDNQASTLAQHLGATITKDLHIINAFAAQIPAEAVLELAQSPQVNWISFDGPVMETSESGDPGTFSLRSDFNEQQYAAGWAETGENDGPQSGDVVVANFLGGALTGVRIQGAEKGIQGQFGIPGALNAVLSVGYRRKGFEAESDFIAIEISNDGGGSWTEVERLAGPVTDPNLMFMNLDITPFLSDEILLRFVSAPNFGTLSKFYIDYVQIEYQAEPEAPQVQPYAVMLPIITTTGSSEPVDLGDLGVTTAVTTENVRDEFEDYAYNNNDGSTTWSTNWLETGDDGTPGGYDIALVYNNFSCPNWGSHCLKIDANTKNISIERGVDLSQAATATLTFNYKINGWRSAYNLEVSTDGGQQWAAIKTYSTPAIIYNETIDLSGYRSANTRIRFRVIDKDRRASLNLDNINIAYEIGSITPPSPVSNTPQTVRDTFSTVAYNNNDGTMDWDNSWVENDPYGGNGPAGGYVYVQNGRLVFHYAYVNAENVHRTVDLTGSTQATLTFDWQTVGLDNGETISVLISQGNSTPFVELAQLGGSQSDSASYDISEYISNNTTIRIENKSSNWDWGEHAAFDNFQITYACVECIDTTNLDNTYVQAIRAEQVWNEAPYLQGQGVTVAVVDSGIAEHIDLTDEAGNSRILTHVQFMSGNSSPDDLYGHGTHIAGSIAGNGTQSNGRLIGVAPKANLVDVKVIDDHGAGYTSDVVAGIQWIYDNHEAYNIRVVNVSLNSAVVESYNTSPLDAALEILWFNGLTIVVSAGNNGAGADGYLYAPGNDPFFITVGATDNMGTVDIGDDILAPFSAHGNTQSGFQKPDALAPGVDIISLLASDDNNLILEHPDHAIISPDGSTNFHMSGTSMSSAVASGVVALLLQDEPDLNPDQVKYRLMATGSYFETPQPGPKSVAYLDVPAAINGTTNETANTDIPASKLLWGGDDPVNWSSVNWGSVNWGSVNWGSVNWGSVNWGSVNWGS